MKFSKKIISILSCCMVALLVAAAILYSVLANNNPNNSVTDEATALELFNKGINELDSQPSPAVFAQENVVLMNTDIFLPEDYGAKADGSTDDSAAVNKAIEAAKKAGGTVLLKKGVYKLNSSITVPENVDISFAGGAKISIASGKVFTINSEKVIASQTQIFTGDGSVAYMPNVEYGYSEWWGAAVNDNADDAPAIQKATNSLNCVYFLRGKYNIKTTVTLPADREICLMGMGTRSTNMLLENGVTAFMSASAKKVSVSYMLVSQVNTANKTAVFIDKTNGALEVESMLSGAWGGYYGLGTFAKLKNTSNSNFLNLYCNGNGCTLILNGGNKNTVLDRCMQLDGGGHVKATDGEGLYMTNSSSVWCYGVDVELTNYKNVKIVQGGYDLGWKNLQTNQMGVAALNFKNVSGFEILGCWVASNSGLSFADDGVRVGEAKDRIGIRLEGCQNGIISGCTITNHYVGVSVLNSPASAQKIVIYGNSFVGNKGNSAAFTSAKAIEMKMNFHCQWTGDFNITEVTGSNSEVLFYGESFRYLNSDATLKGKFTNSTITCEKNLYSVS